MAEADDKDIDDVEEVDEDEEEVESPALVQERLAKEMGNAVSPTGPPAEPISEGDGTQPQPVQDYRSP